MISEESVDLFYYFALPSSYPPSCPLLYLYFTSLNLPLHQSWQNHLPNEPNEPTAALCGITTIVQAIPIPTIEKSDIDPAPKIAPNAKRTGAGLAIEAETTNSSVMLRDDETMIASANDGIEEERIVGRSGGVGVGVESDSGHGGVSLKTEYG